MHQAGGCRHSACVCSSKHLRQGSRMRIQRQGACKYAQRQEQQQQVLLHLIGPAIDLIQLTGQPRSSISVGASPKASAVPT